MRRAYWVASLLCLAAWLVPLHEALGAPRFVRLSYVDDPSTSMTVTWHTDGNVGSEVRYGLATGDYALSATGDPPFQADAPQFGYIHEVTLTGLTPSTTYYYIAGSDADGFSQEHEFVTGPVPDQVCGTFSFAYLGDNRPDPTFGGGENWNEILDQAWARNPAFFLNGGDLVTDGDNIDGWIHFLEWTTDVAAQAKAAEAFLCDMYDRIDASPRKDTSEFPVARASKKLTPEFFSKFRSEAAKHIGELNGELARLRRRDNTTRADSQ